MSYDLTSLLSGAQEGITVRRNRDGLAVWVSYYGMSSEDRRRCEKNIALSNCIQETDAAAGNRHVA